MMMMMMEQDRRYSCSIYGRGSREPGLGGDVCADIVRNGEVRIREGDRGCVGNGMVASRFDERMVKRESAAMKFQWKKLLADESTYTKVGGIDGDVVVVDDRSRVKGAGYPEYQEYGGRGTRSSGLRDVNGPVRIAKNAPLSTESDRDRTLLRYPSSVGYKDDCGDVSGGLWLLDNYSKLRFDEEEALCCQGVISRSVKGSDEDEQKPRIYSSVDGSRGPTPLYQSNYLQMQAHGISREYVRDSGSYHVGHRPPDPAGYCPSHEVLSVPSSIDEYSPSIRYRAVEAPTSVTAVYPGIKYSPTEEIRGAYVDSLSVKVSEEMSNDREHYSHQALLHHTSNPSPRALDASEISHWRRQSGSVLHEYDVAFNEQPLSDLEFMVSHASSYTDEVLDPRSTRDEYETEGTGSSYLIDEYGCETVAYAPSYEERQGRAPETKLDPAFYMMDKKRLSGDMTMGYVMHERNHSSGKRMSGSRSSELSQEAYALDIPHVLGCNRMPIKAAAFSPHGMKRLPLECDRFSKYDSSLRSSKLSISLQNRLGKRISPGRSRVKKRLKHASPSELSDVIIDEYDPILASGAFTPPGAQLREAYTTNIRKRLMPSPWVSSYQHAIAPQEEDVSHHRSTSNHKQKRYPVKKLEDSELEIHAQEDDTSIVSMKPVEDPPENTEEFMRQVQDSFLKYIRFLNDNLGRLRKFKEQGKAGGLTCIVCSSSKEFMDTKSIAMHAFSSPKVGSRCKHLGLHKALCVLMGWDSSLSSVGRWSCKSLANADALAVNEDLIIWPPIVIIHHSCSGGCHLSGRNPALDLLETVLRGMGFDMGKNKVCRGKPGNPNIMAVKFTGTKSGLQEAERLHDILAQKKHGRTELQKINPSGCHHKEEEREALTVSDMEENLFGYLGIAGDLDKLHRDVKALCVVRSKKETLAKIRALEEAAL